MAAKTNTLSMIGHGTKGSDGIAEGIHLRWSFNDKLGFPPCFKLYRRVSDSGNMYHLPIERISVLDLVLPYSVDVIQNETLQYTLESLIRGDRDIGYIDVESVTMPDGAVQRCLHINEGTLTVLFSKPVSRIEVAFYLESDSELSVSTITGEKTSHVHHQSGGQQAWEILSFDAPGTTGLIIEGINIRILAIETWMVSKSGGDWVRINQNCGCGLPVNQEGTNYTKEYYQGLMIDLATALCRLGYLRLVDSPITLAGFLELKALLLSLTEEGMAVPVGWNLFPGGTEEVEEGETAQTVEFSKYDFLLTQSLQVFFAKILGLYFTDTDVVNNQHYDYKITAEWPEWNKRRLDHQFTCSEYEVDDELMIIQQLNDDVVLVSPTKSYVVEEVSDEWRTEKGLRVTPTNIPVVINFLKPITEVQLVIFNPGLTSGNPSIEIEAYRNGFTAYVDKEILFVERGMVRLRATQIDYIRIKGGEATLSRIHYDSELYPVGLQEYIINGLIKRNHIPIQPPRDLMVSFIPGGTITNEDGTLTEKPYLAGIRWDANENPKADLISIAPVLYHAKRKPQGGVEEWITDEAPLFVAPSEEINSDQASPSGWPTQRQYLTDQISLDQVMKYSVAALDLFGRLSEFTPFETYTISPPKAPHPLKVSAKYLDYSSYNPVDHTFSDTTLNRKDKEWLVANGTNAIAVRWEWPLNAQRQAPEVDRFKIYFKPAWLNNFTGMLVGVAVSDTLNKTGLNLTEQERKQFPIFDTSPEELEVYRFEIELHEDRVPPGPITPPVPPPLPPFGSNARRPGIPENIFRLCWMTQSNQSFLVIKNNDDPKPTVWALKLEGIPKAAAGFSIALPPEKEFFIDYREPGNWPVILHEETRDGRTSYLIYIENPPFPDPAMKAEDVRKVRYAQIGVGSCIDSIAGSVSPPATIMAIYHEAPPAPLAFIPDEDDVDALQATRANIHGKSSFAVRWNKTSTPVKFQVQRALDETLFKVDHAVRPTRDDSVYDTFIGSHTYFSEANVEAIKTIPEPADINDVMPQYRNLTPLQLQILASLPDNQKAFTRINETPIDQSDPVYADRVTEIPDPANGSTYSPSDDVLLFVDNTLNGQSNNYFFYALKSVDTNGLSSALSLSTLPVAIPKTTRPPAPVITSITGGEHQIAIAWAKNTAAAIVGYLVYRTQVQASARDWRKMELIKTNSSDAFTVSVGEDFPEQFVFIDATVIPRQPYYYGVIAVGLSDEGKWLKSKMSNVVVGQGYSLMLPEPPVWINVARNINEVEKTIQVVLQWSTSEKVKYVIKRRVSNSEIYIVLSDWIEGSSVYNPLSGRWDDQYTDLQISQSDLLFAYMVSVKSDAGNINTSEESILI